MRKQLLTRLAMVVVTSLLMYVFQDVKLVTAIVRLAMILSA